MIKGNSNLISPQFYAEGSEFSLWLRRNAEHYEIYGVDDENRFRRVGSEEISGIKFNPIRSLDSVKSLFFPARSKLGSAFIKEGISGQADFKRIVSGLKSCDLVGLKVLDNVFLSGEFKDGEYQRRREGTLIISSDCVNPGEFCFCLALGGGVFIRLRGLI